MELLDEFITMAAKAIGYSLPASAAITQDFHSCHCATKSNELSTSAIQLKELFKVKHHTTHHQLKARQCIASDIGLKNPPKLDEYYLHKLHKPFPPANHIILE